MMSVRHIRVIKIWSPYITRHLHLVLGYKHQLVPLLTISGSCRNQSSDSSDDVISHINKLIDGRIITVATRNELQNRVKFLQKQGLSINDIVQNVHLVKIPQSDIMKHVTKKPQDKNSTKTELLKLLPKLDLADNVEAITIPAQHQDLISLLTWELKISNFQAMQMLKRHPFLKRTEIAELRQRISVLITNGVTSNEIYKNYTALKNSVVALDNMITEITFLKKSGYISGDFRFAPWLCQVAKKNTIAKMTHWSQLRQRAESLMALMDVSKTELQTVDYFKGIGIDQITKKMNLFKQCKINGKNLVNHSYIMMMPYNSIHEAMLHCQECGIDHPTVCELINYIMFKKVPQVSRGPRQYVFLSKELNMPCHELRTILKDSWMAERLTLKNNLDFLQEQGFSVADMRKFPIILGHDHECLKTCANSLSTRPELQPFEQFSQNKSLLLNSLQYFLEQTVNFSGKIHELDTDDSVGDEDHHIDLNIDDFTEVREEKDSIEDSLFVFNASLA